MFPVLPQAFSEGTFSSVMKKSNLIIFASSFCCFYGGVDFGRSSVHTGFADVPSWPTLMCGFSVLLLIRKAELRKRPQVR